jgi:hypothetical protein
LKANCCRRHFSTAFRLRGDEPAVQVLNEILRCGVVEDQERPASRRRGKEETHDRKVGTVGGLHLGFQPRLLVVVLIKIGPQVLDLPVSLIGGHPRERHPAPNARASIAIAWRGLVSNSASSGIPARRHRSRSAIHGSARYSSRSISTCPRRET